MKFLFSVAAVIFDGGRNCLIWF